MGEECKGGRVEESPTPEGVRLFAKTFLLLIYPFGNL